MSKMTNIKELTISIASNSKEAIKCIVHDSKAMNGKEFLLKLLGSDFTTIEEVEDRFTKDAWEDLLRQAVNSPLFHARTDVKLNHLRDLAVQKQVEFHEPSFVDAWDDVMINDPSNEHAVRLATAVRNYVKCCYTSKEEYLKWEFGIRDLNETISKAATHFDWRQKDDHLVNIFLEVDLWEGKEDYFLGLMEKFRSTYEAYHPSVTINYGFDTEYYTQERVVVNSDGFNEYYDDNGNKIDRDE